MSRYRLHYAPDNASLCVRLALEELGQPYETTLVDRRVQGQRSPAYLKLNPNGLIPVLETPQGPIFETAAILLWLADTHGALAPNPDTPERATFLKWLFFLSNSLHPALRRRFYAAKYIGPDPTMQTALRATAADELTRHLSMLENAADLPAPLTVLDCYLAPMLRWARIYPAPSENDWFELAAYPRIATRIAELEARASTRRVAIAEGLGQRPFTAPEPPQPPEGSAL